MRNLRVIFAALPTRTRRRGRGGHQRHRPDGRQGGRVDRRRQAAHAHRRAGHAGRREAHQPPPANRPCSRSTASARRWRSARAAAVANTAAARGGGQRHALRRLARTFHHRSAWSTASACASWSIPARPSVALSSARRPARRRQLPGGHARLGCRRPTASFRSTPVKLDTVRVGDITLNNVDAVVIEGDALPIALLGMSFLNRMEMKRDGDDADAHPPLLSEG